MASKFFALSFLGLTVAADATRLHGAGTAKGGWCYAYYADTWCYTVTKAKGTTYAKEGSGGYSCKSYNNYKAENYCYNPPKPATGGETLGAGSHASHAAGASSAAESTGTWKCSSKWYKGQRPSNFQAAKDWTHATNVYRCMHDVQFAHWSVPVANDIKTYLAPLTSMQHSNCYDVKAPAGPAGENLFWGSGSWSEGDAVASWYSEVKDPGCSLPGCGGGFSHGTGHFTAIAWAGVKEIGCTSNAHGLKACRYKGSDTLDCSTPNMGGCYQKNVPAVKKSFAACSTVVNKCFGASSVPSGVKPARLYSVSEGVSQPRPGFNFEHIASGWIAAVAVGVAGAMMVVAGVVMRRRNSQQGSLRIDVAEEHLIAE
eukprot:TRINITY_DN694_c0_g1_i11.p1 TRINITY_DN694_c0_g1~~TRINITY_DN694_c0_g1_i11.p1  ORF type:complete len:391 (+),score=60.91 TRINITY_DN694_c0_g1_i11:63-1175(+)